MSQRPTINHPLLNYAIAFVWIGNGLFCKVLGLVPRHERIVAAILGNEHAGILTQAIGGAEVVMACWILLGWRKQLCAAAQIVVVATMNTLEFCATPELLLWGRANAVFALMFIVLVYWNAFGPSNKAFDRT